MAKDKKKAKHMSDHAKRKARRAGDLKSGYEYQMSVEQYEFLTSEDGGRMKSPEEVIDYLNCTGGFMRPIIRLTVA